MKELKFTAIFSRKKNTGVPYHIAAKSHQVAKHYEVN